MTYFPIEHTRHLRALGDIFRDLEAIHEDRIPELILDLAERQPTTTGESRRWLNDAKVGLGLVLGAIDEARNLLPTPDVQKETTT